MKQSEKSKITYERILLGAIIEFGTHSYEAASINNICSNNGISKGLIYHNFKNKDELYLCCVENCFKEITRFISKAEFLNNDFCNNLKKLLDLRYEFFRKNPYYSNIFFNTVLQPPKHLLKEIKNLRSEFDEFNYKQYKRILSNIKLRDNISQDEALEYFFIFQEMFNGYFQSKAYENSDINSLINEHEIKLEKILNIMFYGITNQDKGDK